MSASDSNSSSMTQVEELLPRSPSPSLKAFHLSICAYGDVQIVLQDDELIATYHVSSHQLCSASSVFRAMLGPDSRFLEADELRHRTQQTDNDELYKLFLEEDNPRALAVVLNVIHGRRENVPQEVSFEQLMELAIICDKYDCAPTLWSMANLWMEPWREYCTQDDYENWLFIAFVFGDPQTLEKTARAIMIRVHFSDGELVLEKDNKRFDTHIPEKVLSIITSAYKNFMVDMLIYCKRRYQLFEDSNIVCKGGKKNCDALRLGFLHKAFKRIHILDAVLTTEVESVNYSLQGLLGELVENLPVKSSKGSYYDDHTTCQPGEVLIPNLESVLENESQATSFLSDLNQTISPMKWPEPMTWDSILQ